MPDRIQTFEAQVAVQDTPSFRPVLAQYADAGAAITGTGRSLLQAFEPKLAARADDAAMRDVGSAEVMKDANGAFMRPVMPKGAGLRYSRLYDNVMDNRLVDLTTKDYENALNEIGARKFMDPQGFMNEAVAVGEGRLKSVDPRIRAQVESNFTREASERFRGISQLKASNDWNATVDGLKLSVSSRVAKAGELFVQGGPDAALLATRELLKAGEEVQQLQKLGEFSPLGAEATMRNIDTQMGDSIRFRQSADNLATFGGSLGKMDDEQLARVALFGAGTTDGGTVTIDGKEVTFDQFTTMFPAETVRRQAGSIAGTALNARLSQRAAEEAAKRADAAQVSADKLLGAVNGLNFDPVNGFSKDQVAALETEYTKNGSAHDQMRTPEGRLNTMAFVSTYGFLPKGVVEFIEGQVNGGNVAGVIDFVQNTRTFQRDGVWIGENLYQQLDAPTRAAIDYDESMRRADIPQANRQVRLEELRRGQLPKLGDIYSIYNERRDGVNWNYNTTRNDVLAKVVGLKVEQVPAATILLRDFDELLPYNFQLYPGNPQKAMRVTAEQVNRGWAPSRLFIGGVAPRDVVNVFSRTGATLGELDTAFLGNLTPAQKRQNPNNYNFTGANGGYALLRPLYDNPAKGYGTYNIIFLTNDGRQVGAIEVNLDEKMVQLGTITSKRKNATAQKQRDAANRDHKDAGKPGQVAPILPM